MPSERDDLFRIFPDLPWFERGSREHRRRAIDAGLEQWRERALKNIVRQRAAAAAMKKRVASRRTIPR